MKPSYFKLIVLLISSFFVVNSVEAQITSQEVDALVTTAMKEMNVAGVAVAIVKDGKIVHNQGYGVTSVDTKQKVNEHTQFAIASNSKAFTTAALAILVEDGKISWTDKVKEHIPEFKMYNDYVTENFNIQDLLTHRSGLGLGVGDLMFFPNGADFTIDDLLASFQYFKPVSAFRTQFDYDNLLYFVAGELIERVSGKTWEVFVKDEIFEPLNMESTFGTLSLVKDKSNLAKPHIAEDGTIKTVPFEELAINGAPGGIISSVDDLSNWMLTHLNKGKFGDTQLFTEDSQHEMWKIHTVLEPNRNPRYNTHFTGYGLGWGLKDVKGNMMVQHTGGLVGMLSKTTMIPDINFGVVVLTNTSNSGGALFSAVTNAIVDSYLGLDDFKWVEKYAKRLKESVKKGDVETEKVWEFIKSNKTNSSINIEDYVGVFEDNWFGKAEVTIKDNQLWFRSHRSPKLNAQMHFYKGNTFVVKWPIEDLYTDTFIMFGLGEEGKTQTIKLKGISPKIDFSYDFHDLNFERLED
jgi:CubicO group peptidase (beta-lactamase class C family)